MEGLENKNPTVNTGRDTLFSVDDLVVTIAKLINSGEYLDQNLSVIEQKKLILKALVPIEDIHQSFYRAVERMTKESGNLEASVKQATGKFKDLTQKTSDSLMKLEKVINIHQLEKRVELLERTADAMERLNKLQETGKLDKILQAIK